MLNDKYRFTQKLEQLDPIYKEKTVFTSNDHLIYKIKWSDFPSKKSSRFFEDEVDV